MSVFEKDPALTAVVEDIKHCGGGVADCIAPIVPVPACTYKYTVFDNTDYYKIPNAKVAGCAYPNEVECEPFVTKSRETQEYFLDKYICERDYACFLATRNNAPSFDWLARQSRSLMNKLLMYREYQVINNAFDTSQYTAVSAATDLNNDPLNGYHWDWSAVAGPSGKNLNLWDPTCPVLETLMCIIDQTSPRVTKLVLGSMEANALRRHPDFLGAGCVVSNLADLSSIEALLGVELCISNAYFDKAAFGTGVQDLTRFLKGKMLFITDSSSFDGVDCGQAQFAWTGQWRDTFAGRILCPKRGGRGGFYLRAGWDYDVYVNHKLGFLITGVESKQP